jgi:hypothetical protein
MFESGAVACAQSIPAANMQHNTTFTANDAIGLGERGRLARRLRPLAEGMQKDAESAKK